MALAFADASADEVGTSVRSTTSRRFVLLGWAPAIQRAVPFSSRSIEYDHPPDFFDQVRLDPPGQVPGHVASLGPLDLRQLDLDELVIIEGTRNGSHDGVRNASLPDDHDRCEVVRDGTEFPNLASRQRRGFRGHGTPRYPTSNAQAIARSVRRRWRYGGGDDVEGVELEIKRCSWNAK